MAIAAHDHGGRACFYQASARSIPLYLDVGLSAHKLGEYAMVPLKEFEGLVRRLMAFDRLAKAG